MSENIYSDCKFNGVADLNIINNFKSKLKNVDCKHRCNIVVELFSTEMSYIVQLELLIKYFMQPLKSNHLLHYLSLNQIFCNIMQLYLVNIKLLEAMEVHGEDISSVFTTFAPYLKLYSVYAHGYKKAIVTLEMAMKKNKKFRSFIKNQETRPEVQATLISLLIAPIQRVPRYRLLLQSLIQLSPNTVSQVDKDALAKVEDAADHINRLITEADEGEALVKLAKRFGSKCGLVVPGRKILKQGILMKSSKKRSSRQRRYGVLFTDALMLCKGGKTGRLRMSKFLPLSYVKVESALGSALFKVTYDNQQMLLFGENSDSGAEWMTAIMDAVRMHDSCRKTLRKNSTKVLLQKKGLLGISRTKQF